MGWISEKFRKGNFDNLKNNYEEITFMTDEEFVELIDNNFYLQYFAHENKHYLLGHLIKRILIESEEDWAKHPINQHYNAYDWSKELIKEEGSDDFFKTQGRENLKKRIKPLAIEANIIYERMTKESEQQRKYIEERHKNMINDWNKAVDRSNSPTAQQTPPKRTLYKPPAYLSMGDTHNQLPQPQASISEETTKYIPPSEPIKGAMFLLDLGGGRRKKTRKRKKLTMVDYKKILKFYKLSIPKTKKNIMKKAKKIIATKFCNCINKVQKKFIKGTPKGISIGICTKSVVNRKGYKRNKFKCKKRRSVKLYKGGKRRKKKKKTRKSRKV